MGSDNGLAERLRQFGRREIELPTIDPATGKPDTVLIRKVSAVERLALMPTLPESVFLDEKGQPIDDSEERKRRERAYVDSLPPEVREARRAESSLYHYKLLALASEGRVALADALGLGDSILRIAAEITAFSNNGKPEASPAPAAEPA